LLTLLDEQVPVEFAGVLDAAAPGRHRIRTVVGTGWRSSRRG
jgi:hypothetical protein